MKDLSCEAIRKALKEYNREEGAIDRPLFARVGGRIREQKFVGPEDLYLIVSWKSAGRLGIALYNAREAVRRNNPNDVIAVTRRALAFVANDDSEGAAVRSLEELVRLSFVKVPIATAILTFFDPERFGAMDPNAWTALGWMDDGDWEPADYGRYLTRIHDLARRCSLSPREVDAALYWIGRK